MKPNHLFTSMLAVVALLAASCSAPKMAQNGALQDDVYNTTAQAKEYKQAEAVQTAPLDESSNADYYGKTNPNYDMDYSSRIDRFYYGNSWRTYYDPYYNYYGYNNFYGMGSLWGGGFYDNYYSPLSLGLYGSWNYNPYWGPYSAYNYWGTGYYGGGYFGGGYWGGGGGYYAGVNRNNPRPTRGFDSNGRPGANYGGTVPSRGSVERNTMGRPSRSDSYNPTAGASSSNRPARGNSGDNSRPTRTTESRPTYSPPTRESTPPSRPSYSPPASSGSGSSGSGSSSGGGGGGGRPTRGGGRG